MDHFELFEKVSGRISLKMGKILEATLKEACRKTGAQYHEAADEILISGTWEQVSEIRQIINNRIQDDGRSGSTSSSDYSEGTSSKPSRVSFDTLPSIAKYIKCFHDSDLKNIEQRYQIKISWSKDYTKVHIKAHSSVNYNDDLFNLASDKFAETYRHFHKIVTSITFNVSHDGTGYSGELLKNAVCAVPRYVPRLILERSADGSVYTLWGTNLSLSQANQWIREQLGGVVERPRSLSPKGPSKDALTHETANKLTVVVYQGDLTRENADIIVNACNEHLDHAGGVSYAISKAGGPTVQKESDDYVNKHGALTTGNVAITGSGFLHCKHIVHAVGPQWKKHGTEGCIKLFRRVFMNVYEAARKLGARSIAMPAISSGIYGVPKDVCAQVAFSFVDEIDQKLASDPTAKPFEIRLVNIDVEIVKTFTTEFNKWLLKGRKVQRRHSFSAIKSDVKEKPVERKSVDDMHKTPRMKTSLVALRKPLQSSSKDGLSLNTTSVASRIKHGSSGTSLDSISSRVKNGPTSTSSSKVKKITVGTSTLQSPGDPSSVDPPSLSSAGHQSNSNSSCYASVDTSTTVSPSQHGAVLSTSQSTARSKHGSTTTVQYDQNGIGSHSSHSGDDPSDCSICQCPCTDPVSLPKCGHTFCKSCIEKAFTYQKKCPVCQEVYGISEGNQPDGTMDVKSYPQSLPGYERYGCYLITYVIPNGLQGNKHPKPGHKFTGTKRQAFLPANKEGRVVLKMLQKAFDKKLIFTVGRSNTTGQDDCVTWNDIHHKTSFDGGPQKFGYPDPDYLSRVKDELKAKGIVPEEELTTSIV